MARSDKVQENRLREVARRRALILRRSRRRDPRATDYGLYWLSDADGNDITPSQGVTLDDVEAFLQN